MRPHLCIRPQIPGILRRSCPSAPQGPAGVLVTGPRSLCRRHQHAGARGAHSADAQGPRRAHNGCDAPSHGARGRESTPGVTQPGRGVLSLGSGLRAKSRELATEPTLWGRWPGSREAQGNAATEPRSPAVFTGRSFHRGSTGARAPWRSRTRTCMTTLSSFFKLEQKWKQTVCKPPTRQRASLPPVALGKPQHPPWWAAGGDSGPVRPRAPARTPHAPPPAAAPPPPWPHSPQPAPLCRARTVSATRAQHASPGRQGRRRAASPGQIFRAPWLTPGGHPVAKSPKPPSGGGRGTSRGTRG